MNVPDYLARVGDLDLSIAYERECPVCHVQPDMPCNGARLSTSGGIATQINEVHLWRVLQGSRRFRERQKAKRAANPC